MTHTADITSFTPNGGFFIDLTIVMSAGCNDNHNCTLRQLIVHMTKDKRAARLPSASTTATAAYNYQTACADFPIGAARHPRAARNGIVCC